MTESSLRHWDIGEEHAETGNRELFSYCLFVIDEKLLGRDERSYRSILISYKYVKELAVYL